MWATGSGKFVKEATLAHETQISMLLALPNKRFVAGTKFGKLLLYDLTIFDNTSESILEPINSVQAHNFPFWTLTLYRGRKWMILSNDASLSAKLWTLDLKIIHTQTTAEGPWTAVFSLESGKIIRVCIDLWSMCALRLSVTTCSRGQIIPSVSF